MFKERKNTFIIAEIGNNHEGDFQLAKKMILEAAKSGADAVKFQTFIPEYYVSSSNIERIKRLKSFQLTQDQFINLSIFAQKCGVLFFSTPFDLESANFLNQIQPIFKVSSGDNNFYPLIDIISSFGKPIIISTGISTNESIDRLYDRILNKWKANNLKSELALMHCVSSYPVPPEEANLLKIDELIKKYPEASIGYSDHTIGNEASLFAVSIGARIIEKHFTVDKNYSSFRDHKLSADPKEFKELVESIRKIEILRGNGNFSVQDCEKEIQIEVRRSVAAKNDLKKGDKVTIEDITWVRPGTGLPPGNENLIIGRILVNQVNKGQLFSLNDFEK